MENKVARLLIGLVVGVILGVILSAAISISPILTVPTTVTETVTASPLPTVTKTITITASPAPSPTPTVTIVGLGEPMKLGNVSVSATSVRVAKEADLVPFESESYTHFEADTGYKLVIVNLMILNEDVRATSLFAGMDIQLELKVDRGYIYRAHKYGWGLMYLRPTEGFETWVLFEILEDTKPIEVWVYRGLLTTEPSYIIKLT